MTKTNVTPATKEQLNGLIDICLRAGLNNAAGLLTVASAEISHFIHNDSCICLEVIGDNGTCPVHGKGFESRGAFSDDEIKADYQERNDLYNMGVGC